MLVLASIAAFTACKDEDIPPALPTASFSVSGGNCEAPCEVSFTNTSTDATEYIWDFGDGSATSAETNPVHTYQNGGTFSVKLVAKNDVNGGDESIQAVVISANPVITAANELTESLVIDGAILIQSSMPVPSGNGALELAPPTFSIKAFVGQSLRIPLEERPSDEVAGVYFQVKDASTYWDIPFSGLQNGRLSRAQDSLFINLSFPTDISVGELCIEYAIYDSQGNVSNIIETCVEVLPTGGEALARLAEVENWEVFAFNSDGDSIGVGVTEIGERMNYEVPCGDSTGFINIELFYKVENFDMVFSATGQHSRRKGFSRDHLVKDSLDCINQPSYKTSPFDDYEMHEGGWFYDTTTETLKIITNKSTYGFIDDTDNRVVEEKSEYRELELEVRFITDSEVFLQDANSGDYYVLWPK